MEELFSDMPDASKCGSSESDPSILPSLSDLSLTEEDELRSKIEEITFQVLSQTPWVQRLRSTFCVSIPDEDNDFVSLTFPRKLWKIVESDKFKSIWWSEDGTSIVIKEDLFKEEILGRKYPFKIFETKSMKSLVRQLNLYGFSKIQHRFQRSASLVDFLAEEKEASALSKLLCYHNPNFKQGCPQLLARMKRRVRIKNISPAADSLVPLLDNKHLEAQGNVNNLNSHLVAENSGENILSTSGNLFMSPVKQPSSRHMIASSTYLVRNDFSLTSSSIQPSEQITTHQHDILNHVATFHVLSNNSYTQANGHIVNFIPTSTCQYRIIPPLQNSSSGLMVEPSAIPTRYSHVLANDAPESSLLLPAHNHCLPIPTIPNKSTAPFSSSTHQTSSVYQHHPKSNLPMEY
ncbi:heat shock transcription factor, Y-linked-like [Dipodomys merriami]|uniref:heat shock transcription factor, Y-linked-like n=1 Tax=Dipodomys merriami TaxID=94247 RepID=UPI0038559D0B